MRAVVACTALLLAATAHADPPLSALDEVELDDWELEELTPPHLDWQSWDLDASGQVVGGAPAPQGKWPDAVYLNAGGSACTGTLIHPKWVLTAAHCIGGMREALINGVDSSARFENGAGAGDLRRIIREVPYAIPWQTSLDIALVELDQPTTAAKPRVIAQDCVVEEQLFNGADVVVVGWGVTQANGTGSTNLQHEGVTQIQTHDCSAPTVNGMATGCNQPGGELGAGGDVDACFGDSGGPLYLETPQGTYVVGVTSRSYQGVEFAWPCRDGGIYTRPDAVVDWIEETIGEALPRPNCNPVPEVNPEPAKVPSGASRTRPLGLADPSTPGLTFEVVRQPLHGGVTVGPGGKYTFSADPDYAGVDSFVVRITQEVSNAPWPDSPPGTIDVVVPVEIGGGCGCASGPRGQLSWLLATLLLAGMRRRS